MKRRNQYDYLKIESHDAVEPVEATASWQITDSRHETITITTAVLPDGTWVYGYRVFWASGDVSSTKPSPSFGTFRYQRDANLHALGFMKNYLSYFTSESRRD